MNLLNKLRDDDNYNPPPIYYAILMMDGDKIGQWLQGKNAIKGDVLNKGYYRNISKSMVDFSVNKATEIVSENHGELSIPVVMMFLRFYRLTLH